MKARQATARPRVVSLFSGAGGLDLGLERAGFQVLAQVELDRDCAETLRLNSRRRTQKPAVMETTVGAVDAAELMATLGLRVGELELLAGGPPCQAFTTTGRRRALQDERGSVVNDYLRLLRGLSPQYFLMENVTGFFSAALRHRALVERGPGNPPLGPEEKKGSVFTWFLSELLAAGYTVCWGVLDAVDFGVPQFRQRAFLIGSRSERPVFLPPATHFDDPSVSEGARWRTLADAFAGLEDDAPLIQPLSEFKTSVFRHVPAGANWRSLSPELREQTMGRAFLAEGGKGGWWRRLAWDRPSPTILTMPDHSSTGLIHPEETRCLTVRECARCQTFPDTWRFAGSSRSQYRQIGNAVPVALAWQLSLQVKRHMEGCPLAVPGPPVWRQASANQRLGTWGWAMPRNGKPEMHVLNRRDDHVFLGEPAQLRLTEVAAQG